MSFPFQPGTQLSCVAVGPIPVNSSTIPTTAMLNAQQQYAPATLAPNYQMPTQQIQPIQQNSSPFNFEVTVQNPYNLQYSSVPQQQHQPQQQQSIYNPVPQYSIVNQTIPSYQAPLQNQFSNTSQSYLNTSNPCLNVSSQYNQPTFQQTYNQQPQYNQTNVYQNNLRSGSYPYIGFNNNNNNNYDPCLQQNNYSINNNYNNNLSNQFNPNTRSLTSSPIGFHEEVIPLTDEQYSSLSRFCNNSNNFSNLNSYSSQNSLFQSQPNLYNSQPNLYGSQQSLNIINPLDNLNLNNSNNNSSNQNLYSSQPNLFCIQPQNSIYSSQQNLYNTSQNNIYNHLQSNLNNNLSQQSLYNSSNLSNINCDYQNFNNNLPIQLPQTSQTSNYFSNSNPIQTVLTQPSQTSNYFSNSNPIQTVLTQPSQTSNQFINSTYQIPQLAQPSQTSNYFTTSNNNSNPSINYTNQHVDSIQTSSIQQIPQASQTQIPPLIAPTTIIPENVKNTSTYSANQTNNLISPSSQQQSIQSTATIPELVPVHLPSSQVPFQQQSILKDSKFQQNEEAMLKDVIEMYNKEAAAKLTTNPKSYVLTFRKDFQLTQIDDQITFGDNLNSSISSRQSITGTPNFSGPPSPVNNNRNSFYLRDKNPATISSASIDSRQSVSFANNIPDENNLSTINRREYRAPPVTYQNNLDRGRTPALNDSFQSESLYQPPPPSTPINRSSYRNGPTITEINDKSNEYKQDFKIKNDSNIRNIDNKTPVSFLNDTQITIPEVRRPPTRNDSLKEVQESPYRNRLSQKEESSRANNNNINTNKVVYRDPQFVYPNSSPQEIQSQSKFNQNPPAQILTVPVQKPQIKLQIPLQMSPPSQPPIPPPTIPITSLAPPLVSNNQILTPSDKQNNSLPPLSKIENKFDHLNASIDALIQEQKKSNQNLEDAIRNLCQAYYKSESN